MNRSRSPLPFFFLLLLSFASFAHGQQVAGDRRAGVPLVPQPAIRAVIDLLERYPLVMFAETHAAHEEHQFLRDLVADPRFSAVPTDVAVEFGNALYQPVIDRYLLALEHVSKEELQKVWRNTTQLGPDSWDSPVYEQFYRHVRAVNERLEPSRRIRVLLGDPPIDWQRVATTEDVLPFLDQRDPHFARVLTNEVMAKRRRALVIAGALHVIHQEHRPGEPRPYPTVSGIMETAFPGSVYVVAPFTGGISTKRLTECDIDGRFAKWDRPSLARVQGTWYGELMALDLMTPEGRIVRQMQDLIDAVIYLGPANTLREATRVYAYYTEQPEYVQELKRRRTLLMGEPLDPEEVVFYKLGHPTEELPPPPM